MSDGNVYKKQNNEKEEKLKNYYKSKVPSAPFFPNQSEEHDNTKRNTCIEKRPQGKNPQARKNKGAKFKAPSMDSIRPKKFEEHDLKTKQIMSFSPKIKDRMKNLYHSKLYADVIFEIHSGKFTFQAHKAILAVGSPVFAEMFETIETNNLKNNSTLAIPVENMRYEAFRNCVQFLYTDDVVLNDPFEIAFTLTAARFYKVQSLEEKCASFLNTCDFAAENVCTVLQQTCMLNLQKLENRCLDYISENAREVIQSQNFQKVSMQTVVKICQLKSLNLTSESELFEAVAEWLKVNPRAPHNMKFSKVLEPLMKSIRFLTFKPSDFTRVIRSYPNIFDTADVMDIMDAISGGNNPNPKLPQWCNRSRENRCNVETPTPLVRELSSEITVPAIKEIENKRICIPLNPFVGDSTLSNLISIVELQCIRGKHALKGIKLAFQQPTSPESCIECISINLHGEPSGVQYTATLKIESVQSATLSFGQDFNVEEGELVVLRVEAAKINKFSFLQLETNHSYDGNHPFVCRYDCLPRRGNLFFIQEILYVTFEPDT